MSPLAPLSRITENTPKLQGFLVTEQTNQKKLPSLKPGATGPNPRGLSVLGLASPRPWPVSSAARRSSASRPPPPPESTAPGPRGEHRQSPKAGRSTTHSRGNGGATRNSSAGLINPAERNMTFSEELPMKLTTSGVEVFKTVNFMQCESPSCEMTRKAGHELAS